MVATRILSHTLSSSAHSPRSYGATYKQFIISTSRIGRTKLRERQTIAPSSIQASKPSSHPTQTPAQDHYDPLREQRLLRRQQRIKEQASYRFSAIAASTLIVSLAVFATYYRITWHLSQDDAFPFLDLAGTLLFAVGGMVGMEMYARWVHRYLWHENQVGWILHKSHHEPRLGAFEANDIYAIMNAFPAFVLTLYGFTRPDVIGGLCFGAGLGITLFGISYLFVHDGLVHRRFPVGPIAELPALRRIALAHQLHHSEKYKGVPFGMFLGPQELEAVGAKEELDKLVAAATEAAEKKR